MNTKNKIKEALKISAKVETGKAVTKQVKRALASKLPRKFRPLLNHSMADGVLSFLISHSITILLNSNLNIGPERLKKLRILEECFVYSAGTMTLETLELGDKIVGLLENLGLDKLIGEEESQEQEQEQEQ